MAKLKIEDIRAEIERSGWKLLSEEYKNLTTDLHMSCPEGHDVYVSLQKWRRHQDCPVCEKAHIAKTLTTKPPFKPAGVKRILALDDATGTTGYAIFDGETLVTYGKIRQSSADDTIQRIVNVRHWLINMIENWRPDIVSIEDIQLQQGKFQNVKTFKVLAQLQGALLTTLYENHITYFVIPPASWRSTCNITARYRADQKKQSQKRVEEWYDLHVTDDEADAICIGYHTAKKEYRDNYMISWE